MKNVTVYIEHFNLFNLVYVDESHIRCAFSTAVTTYQTVPPNDAIIRSTQHATSTTQVVMVGAGAQCPKCRTGILQEDFTLLGICCAIFFFPLGLICCLMMRQRRCTYCGAVYM